MKSYKTICFISILLICLICFDVFLIHLNIHYRIVLVNFDQSKYIKDSDFFNFDEFKRYRCNNKKTRNA